MVETIVNICEREKEYINGRLGEASVPDLVLELEDKKHQLDLQKDPTLFLSVLVHLDREVLGWATNIVTLISRN